MAIHTIYLMAIDKIIAYQLYIAFLCMPSPGSFPGSGVSIGFYKWGQISSGHYSAHTKGAKLIFLAKEIRPIAGRGGPGVRTPPELLRVTFLNRVNPETFCGG